MKSTDMTFLLIVFISAMLAVILPVYAAFQLAKRRLRRFHSTVSPLGLTPLGGILDQYAAGQWKHRNAFVAYFPNRNREMRRGIGVFTETGDRPLDPLEFPAGAEIIRFDNLLRGNFFDLVLREGFHGSWRGNAYMLLLPIASGRSEIENALDSLHFFADGKN